MKKIDIQVQEAQGLPYKLDQSNTLKHIIKLPKIKDNKRILKAAREKKRVTYKGVFIRPSADFSEKPYRQEGAGKKYLKS